MSLEQLLEEFTQLNRVEKLHVMQTLINELAVEEQTGMVPNTT